MVARFPDLPRVRALEFRYCSFFDDKRSIEFLGSMFKRCSGLKHFRMHSEIPCLSVGVGVHFPAPRVLQILMQHRTALESLDINLTHSAHTVDNRYWNNRDVFVDPHVLREFTVLETLKLGDESFCWHRRSPEKRPWACLSDALPQSVKTLVIRLVEKSFAWNDVAELADQARAGHFPNLEQVTVYAVSYNRSKLRSDFLRQIQGGADR